MTTARREDETQQKDAIPGKRMVRNSAGGFTFAIDDWKRLHRFLILGTEKGSYYASEHKLTVENAEVVRRCIAQDGRRTVGEIVEMSQQGRAPKNDQAVLALGMCLKLGDPQTKAAARLAVPLVCRIGTHIFQLAETIKLFGGWGRGTRRAVGDWYANQQPDRLAMNLVKYQNREGWSHLDLLREAHVEVDQDTAHNALFRWVTCDGDLSARTVLRYAEGADAQEAAAALEHFNQTGELRTPAIRADSYPAIPRERLPRLIEGFELLKAATAQSEVVRLINEYGLPRECVPTHFLNTTEVWDALLRSGRGMPMTAMIRNLGKMTEVGLIKPMSEATNFVRSRLADTEALKQARVHPIAILLAMRTYASGHGMRGNLAWQVDQRIVDALNDAFYGAFQFVEPTGKRHVLGIDVSGSMDGGSVAGTYLTPREAAAAMAMVVARTEPEYAFIGYSHKAVEIPISPSMRLDQVCEVMARIEMGGTDASIPMTWALGRRIDADVFHSYTDNETWAGSIHPSQALRRYRESRNDHAKLAVVAFTSTEFSIADPNDAGMLDVVGFDAAAPEVMAAFARD